LVQPFEFFRARRFRFILSVIIIVENEYVAPAIFPVWSLGIWRKSPHALALTPFVRAATVPAFTVTRFENLVWLRDKPVC
jgi:hypothetical protein